MEDISPVIISNFPHAEQEYHTAQQPRSTRSFHGEDGFTSDIVEAISLMMSSASLSSFPPKVSA